VIFKLSAELHRHCLCLCLYLLINFAEIERLTTLDTGKFVSGLVYTNGTIYVVNFNNNRLKIYESGPGNKRLDDIVISDEKDLRGLAVCEETQQLFIADRALKCIWRVDIASNYTVSKFIDMHYRPWALSVRARRLTISYDDLNELRVYSLVDGKKVLRVPITFTTYYATEYSPGTFLVCHEISGESDGRQHSVSFVDRLGNVTETYQGHVNRPRDLTVDSAGRILVADYYGNRVVIMDSKLTFSFELNYTEHVNRIFYAGQIGQLFVGLEDNGVEVIKWTNGSARFENDMGE
jgi:hypothetical protein